MTESAGAAARTMGPTRAQARAETAWRQVKGIADPAGTGEDRQAKREYASLCKSFPALLHSSGLCQAVAFAKAKGTKSMTYRQYLGDLAATMGVTGGADGLHERSRTAPVGEYLRLTREALASAGWLARYAEALLEDEGTRGATGSTEEAGPAPEDAALTQKDATKGEGR